MAESVATRRSAEIERCMSAMFRLIDRGLPRLRALGTPEWDAQLWAIGREWLAAERPEARAAAHADGPDVYLATQLYADGGHTALIGDFVRALDPARGPGQPAGASSRLILTGMLGPDPFPLPDAIQSRVVLPADRVTIVDGPTFGDRMEQLFTHLLAWRPRRLFLFQHPHDPLASVVAQPEVTSDRFLVHHADTLPTFGLHLPGVRIVDLHPGTAAMTRLQGRASAWLPLTSPDPGPRPEPFLRRGALVTAASGPAHKFLRPYALGYPETLAVILGATGGWHVHIGPLDESSVRQVRDVLATAGVSPDRFVHRPWVPSVAAALWDESGDVFCASFPVDGARTRIEALASGTPYLRHMAPDAPPSASTPPQGELVWRTWTDLADTLRGLTRPGVLARASADARAQYDSTHHPRVFAEVLNDILSGGPGRVDPDALRRDGWALRSIANALAGAEFLQHAEWDLVGRVGWLEARLGELTAQAAEQARRVEALEGENQRLRAATGHRADGPAAPGEPGAISG